MAIPSDGMQRQVRRLHADRVVATKVVKSMQGLDDIMKSVEKVVSDALDRRVVDPDSPLMSLGVNSTMAVQLVSSLETIAGQDLPGTLVFDYPTIR